jgi:hypothetical protein
MRWFEKMAARWRRHVARHEREIHRLRRLYWEGERLRAELSHLEREMESLKHSKLPERQKSLIVSAISVRHRRVEDEMLYRQHEVLASGHVVGHL